MKSLQERTAEAHGYFHQCMENLKHTPAPAGQKFAVGQRVRIAKDLGPSMSHFTADCEATVKYTYAHAFGGNDIKSYSLIFDDGSTSAWYEEHQLSAI